MTLNIFGATQTEFKAAIRRSVGQLIPELKYARDNHNKFTFMYNTVKNSPNLGFKDDSSEKKLKYNIEHSKAVAEDCVDTMNFYIALQKNDWTKAHSLHEKCTQYERDTLDEIMFSGDEHTIAINPGRPEDDTHRTAEASEGVRTIAKAVKDNYNRRECFLAVILHRWFDWGDGDMDALKIIWSEKDNYSERVKETVEDLYGELFTEDTDEEPIFSDGEGDEVDSYTWISGGVEYEVNTEPCVGGDGSCQVYIADENGEYETCGLAKMNEDNEYQWTCKYSNA